MFRPEKIDHIKVFLTRDKVKGLIRRLHEVGVCQLRESEAEFDSLYDYEESSAVEDLHTRIFALNNNLEPYKHVRQPESLVKSFFVPKEPVKLKTVPATVEEASKVARVILDDVEEDVDTKVAEINELNEKIKQNNFVISNLEKLPHFKTSSFAPTEHVSSQLGVVRNASLPKIRAGLSDIAVIGVHWVSKEESVVSVLSSHDEAAKVSKTLHEIGFEVLTVPYEHKLPEQIMIDIKKESDKHNAKIAKVKESLVKVVDEYGTKLEIATEEMEIALEKIESLKQIRASRALTVLEAWVPHKQIKDFNSILESEVKLYMVEVTERKDAPTKYSNHKWIRPFEMITELYSTPKYKGYDPTFLIALFFTCFFGLMLTDFFYGIFLLVFGVLMINAGKFNDTLKQTGVILLFFGISTAVWGVVFGSYFGDFFQKIGVQLPMLIDPMRDVIIGLGLALGLGGLHLLVGLVVGFYDNLFVQKKVKEAFSAQAVWIIFMMSAVLFIVQKTNLAFMLLGLSVAMQVFFNFLEGGAVTAILSIFGFTGFLGDFFSYARLMALGIGTSGISLAVNFMVLLSADLIPVVGIVVGILVFIVGHAFNMAMNGLGAFIHSTRLHFLEFFQKFYDGGGSKYAPFKVLRKTTYTEE